MTSSEINLIGHDIENTGNHLEGQLLLSSFYKGGSEELLVVDNKTVSNFEVFTKEDLKKIIFISHNAAHEARFHSRTGFLPNRFACTMVRSKVLTAGVEHLGYSLVEELKRRGIPQPSWMNKDIRSNFSNHQGLFLLEEIFYNGGDSLILPALYEAQERFAVEQGQEFLINSLRSRVIRPLAEAEVTGFVHNSAKWLEIANTAKTKAEILSKELDQMLIDQGVDVLSINKGLAKEWTAYEKRKITTEARKLKLEEQVRRFEEKGKTELKAYKLAKEQLTRIDTSTAKVPQPLHVVWGSSQQVIDVLKTIGCPLPMGKDQKTRRLKPSVGKQARNDWFTEHGNSQFAPLMSRFDKYKKLTHNINAFGEKWISNYTNPTTGKVHTIFRQADTTTLRLSSGNAYEGFFNLQQIPSRDGPEYRSCFGTEPGRGIITLDYTGCEVVCMISLSRDLELKRISELPDQHSYMGTKCWRAVYAYRAQIDKSVIDGFTAEGREVPEALLNQYQKNLTLSETYVMKNEGEGKKMRTKFKESGIFPVIYGVHPPKVASIQGFTVKEGEIFIKTIEADMPNVVSFVKSQAQFAVENGYVIHNQRAKSRRWFWPVIEEQMYGYPLSRTQIIEIESAARNTCIQGTNVDIVVEAMCMIDLWKRLFNVDIRLLGQVHDELIYDAPIDKLEWTRSKLVSLMERAAKNYLIPEISMRVDSHIADHWVK